jgi:hypothetical protein
MKITKAFHKKHDRSVIRIRNVAQIVTQVTRENGVLLFIRMHWNEAVSDDEDEEEADSDSESNKPLKKPQQSFISEDKSDSRKPNDSAILGFSFSAAGLIMRKPASSKNSNQSEYCQSLNRESDPETS